MNPQNPFAGTGDLSLIPVADAGTLLADDAATQAARYDAGIADLGNLVKLSFEPKIEYKDRMIAVRGYKAKGARIPTKVEFTLKATLDQRSAQSIRAMLLADAGTVDGNYTKFDPMSGGAALECYGRIRWWSLDDQVNAKRIWQNQRFAVSFASLKELSEDPDIETCEVELHALAPFVELHEWTGN